MKDAKAGAGLPSIERLFIKNILVPLSRIVFNWINSLKLLQKEAIYIERLIKDIPKEKLQKRVKIDRVFGIEEHSRDYSINLTLEHITIVGNAMIFVIDTLSKEEPIEKEIKIEDVKPTKNDQDEDKEFFLFIKNYTKFIQNHSKIKSKMTKKHPWFVEFSNKDWAVFTYIHTFIHRRQIEAIIKKL